MRERNIVVLVSVLVAVMGVSWGYAQQKSARGMLTPQDYIEIQQLYATYSHTLDKAEGARFAATFTVDGEFTRGRPAGRGNEVRTPLKGTEALTRMGSVGGGRHFTANLTITPTPDGARGSCYLLLFDARNVPATLTETAIYDDTLVRTPQGWRFKKRVVWRDDDDISPFKPNPRS
jgi:hypothetical protein